MFGCKTIESGHLDLIHDVKYDHYGKRMVTCSSDQIIKVWELNEEKEWICISKLQGHHGSVWKVTWAHPEYGQVIASCGFDRTISIWEEITSSQHNSAISGKSDWVRRTQLVDPRTPVTDIQFAPRHLGLQLASCSTDGMVRLYEAQDVMDLSQWTLQHDFPTKITASCLSWSQSSAFPTLLAVGNCNSDSENKVLIYEFMEFKRNCKLVQTLEKVEGSVHDVSFAPCMGHSYHTLAVAADNLYIFYIKHNPESSMSADGDNSSASSPRLFIEQAKLEPSQSVTNSSKVWRVSWNITGTLLAASGEDGVVHMWRRNYMRVWSEVINIRPEDGVIGAVGTGSGMLNAGSNIGLRKPGLSGLPQAPSLTTQQVAYQPYSTCSDNMIGLDSGYTKHSTPIFNTNYSQNVQFQKKAGIPNKNEIIYS